MTTVNKQPIFINLSFKVHYVASTIKRRPNTVSSRTYSEAKLLILHKTCLITQTKVDKHPFSATVNCVYKFTCTCQISHIGRTERPYLGFIKHVLKSLRVRERTTLNNATTKYILDEGHQIDTLQSFKVINKHPSSKSSKVC